MSQSVHPTTSSGDTAPDVDYVGEKPRDREEREQTERLRPDEDLVDVLSIDFSISAEIERDSLVKRVDEKVKELVLVDFIVYLLVLNTPSASRRLN